MEDRIRQDLKSAMIAKNEVKVATLRLLLSELTYSKVAKGSDILSDTDIITTVQKEIKKRKESIESFKNAARNDLVSKEEAELEVLQEYLPSQLSDEELTKIVEEVINNMGASTPSDMGKVIGAVMGKVGQQAEGSRVSALVRARLV